MRQPEPIWISFEGGQPPARRTLDAAILGRLPQARRALMRMTLRLPRRSGLRQALLLRSVLQVQGAWMRGDFELALGQYHGDVVLTTSNVDALARLDFETTYRGRNGVREFVQTYQGAFSDPSYEPKWLVDLGGNKFVMLLHHSVRGRASGIEVEQLSAHRVELRDGLVVREEVVTARRDDLEPVARAVGIDPAELASRRAVERAG